MNISIQIPYIGFNSRSVLPSCTGVNSDTTSVDLNTLPHFICKHAMGLPKSTGSDICESLPGLLPMSSDIDKRKLQFLGRLCNLETKTPTMKIFLYRLFPYIHSHERKKLDIFMAIIKIMVRYNLTKHLLSYLQFGYLRIYGEKKLSNQL